MICKWCGNKVTPGELQCRNCGREVPAISDCGGFYDLTGGAKPGQMPTRAEPRTDLSPLQEEMKRSTLRHGKWLNSLRLTMVMLFLVVIILQIVLLIQVGSLNGKIGQLMQLHNEDSAIAEPAEPSEEKDPIPEDTTEPTEAAEEKSIPGGNVTYQGRKIEPSVTEKVDEDGTRTIHAEWNDPDFSGTLTVTISLDDQGETILNADFAFSGQPDEKDTRLWSWEYWSSGQEKWIPLADAEGTPLTEGKIVLTQAQIDALAEAELRLRCTITQTHADEEIIAQIADIII